MIGVEGLLKYHRFAGLLDERQVGEWHNDWISGLKALGGRSQQGLLSQRRLVSELIRMPLVTEMA
jgi:hypothetical protein